MSAHPLTHHEILALVEPFARRGRRVDLAASDRVARRIAFRPVERASDAPDVPDARESLELEATDGGGWRLRRRLVPDDGPAAELVARGEAPGALLERVDAVAPRRQLARGPGWTLATDHRLEPIRAGAADPGPAIVRGTIRVAGLELAMKVPTVSGISADVAIVAPAGDPIELPDDLLAVLGRGWTRLDRTPSGWTTPVGLSGRGASRLADAESRLRTAAAHLALTLAEPPRRFHERLRGARWRVAAWRCVPLLACIGLLAGATAVPSLGLADESPIWMLIFNAPPLMLVAFFCLREMPRIELPRVPRAPTAPAWRVPAAAPATAAPGVPAPHAPGGR